MSTHDRESNRAHWDALAAVHGQDDYYDADALVAGADSLTEAESAAVGEVDGLEVLHLQCHIGFDSISLARRGARVTGADFSPASLAKARGLAERAGVEVEFVEADATALPPELRGRFDVVYSTMGVICWIEEIADWMRSVHAALRPGGRLVLVEIHPLYNMVAGREPLALDFPYAADGPRRFEAPGSYADRDAEVAVPTEIVSRRAGAGGRGCRRAACAAARGRTAGWPATGPSRRRSRARAGRGRPAAGRGGRGR